MDLTITKDNRKIRYLYHYTPKENVEKILSSKKLISKDPYIFATDSYEKSVELFEQEMMSDHIYIDVDCNIKKRIPAKKEDYRIIKIPYKNDGKFVYMKFDYEIPNSIYSKSRIHKGTIYFDKAEILEIRETEELIEFNFYNKFKWSMLLSSFSIGLLLPKVVNADTWLDPGNYDTSWYDTYADKNYAYINTPEEFAGLAYLVNIEGIQLDKKIQINNPLDLTAHDWVPLDSSFPGIIDVIYYSHGTCGNHRVILKQINGENEIFKSGGICTFYYKDTEQVSFLHENSPCNTFLTFEHYWSATIENENHGIITFEEGIYKKGSKLEIMVQADENYRIEEVYIESEDGTLRRSAWKVSDNHYEVNMIDAKAIVKASIRANYYNITTELDNGVTILDLPDHLEYGESYELNYQVEDGYEVVGILINDEPIDDITEPIILNYVSNNYNIQIITRKKETQSSNEPENLISNIINPFTKNPVYTVLFMTAVVGGTSFIIVKKKKQVTTKSKEQ